MTAMIAMAVMLGLLSTLCQAAAPLPQAQIVSTRAVIRTASGLEDYLKATPADESPLSLLPQGARRRFLGTLIWRDQGVGGFSTADLTQYLSTEQIHRVLGLFGAEGYAEGLHGRSKPLTAAERVAPETPLERKFDELYFARANVAHGGHSIKISAFYDDLLAPYQSASILAGLDDSDLGLLYRAASITASESHTAGYLDDLRLDFAAMNRRGLATTAMTLHVHDQFVAGRRFAEANAFAAEYSAAGIKPLPPLQQTADVRDGNPTALTMQPGGKAMQRKPIDMQAPLRIVVVAGCHFSEDAARAIGADPQLDELFREHAVWLADENESLSDVLQWNREFPNQVMHVAWRNSEWRMLDSWAIPTFYVFRGGNLVEQWSGWSSDKGMQSLRTHLDSAGLLR